MTRADLAVLLSLNRPHVGALGARATPVYAVFSPVSEIVVTAARAAGIWLRSRRLSVALTSVVVVAVA